MSVLNVRGIHSANVASEFSSDEVGTIDDTFLFPKWWDKNAGNVEYIRVFKVHMNRSCDDIDVIIPASSDVEIHGDYDGNVGFRIDFHRGVKRMALTARNSTKVDAEYIFPTRPSQQPRYVKYGEGPIICGDPESTGSWREFFLEFRPTVDMGGLETAIGHYDLEDEPFNGFDLGSV